MEMNRRQLISGVAIIGSVGVAGCSNILGTGVGISTSPGGGVTVTLPANVNTFVQKIVAGAAQYAPTIESIAQEAASLFGPGYVSIVTIGSAAINTLISALENLTAPPPTAPATTTTASAVLSPSRKRLTLRATLIGMTAQGVRVYGVR